MTRRQKEPLRPLTGEERITLERVSRAGSARADRVDVIATVICLACTASNLTLPRWCTSRPA